MDLVITYDTVKTLVANPPSLGNQPNFINLCPLGTHFARVLKRIPCPQSTINGWSSTVLSPSMYALIDEKTFKNEMELRMLVPDFPPIFASNGTTVIPYTPEQTLKITAKFTRKKNYYNTACNIYCAVYNMLDMHVDNGFNVAPSTVPPTIGWNTSMSLNEIFDQLMKTYDRPTPNAMRQNMTTLFPLTIPRTLSRSYSSGVPTAKKLRNCNHRKCQVHPSTASHECHWPPDTVWPIPTQP
jgi:hypothetical protein